MYNVERLMVINSRIQNTFMKRYKTLGQKRIVNQNKNKFREETVAGNNGD